MTSFKKISRLAVLAFLALLLVACGTTDSSPNSGNTSTNTTSTTSTTGNSTITNTTVSTTTSVTIPVDIAGLTPVNISTGVEKTVAAKIGATTGPNTQFGLYASATNEPTAVANQIDSTMSNAGYKFALPQLNKQFQQGNLWVGLYSKSGGPDLLTITGDPAAFKSAAQSTSTTNLDSILNGQKSVVVIVSAPNLSNAILGSPADGTTSAK